MKLLACAAAVLSLSAPLSAHADATASAQIGSFRYELIDLDPNDGIDSAITFTGTQTLLVSAYYPDISLPPATVDIGTSPGTAGIAVAAGTGSSTADATSALATATFTGAVGELASTAQVSRGFTLTANTQLIIYGDAAVSGIFDPSRYAYSYAGVYIAYLAEPGDLFDTYTDDFITSAWGSSESRELTATISSGDTALTGDFGLTIASNATVTAVPEPSQYALMLLGLAGLGWKLRRAGRGR